MVSNRPDGMLNQRNIDTMLRLVDTLDIAPTLWSTYRENVLDFVRRVNITMGYYQEQIRRYSGGWSMNRKGNPMTRRGRNMKTKEHIWATRSHVCAECGNGLVWAIAVAHHIVEIANGGDDSDDNLALLCANCHGRRHGSVMHK